MVRNPTTSRCPRQAQNPLATRRWPLRLGPMDWKKLAWVAAPALALVVIVLMFLNHFLNTLPARAIALRTVRGGLESPKRLVTGKAMAGFVQGGTAEAGPSEGLRSLGSLYYEPVWLFHRRTKPLRGLTDLQGLRIQVGEEGSGIRPLAVRLVRDSGVTAQNSNLLALT